MPIFHDLQQGSDIWKDMRRKSITATDLPVIMQISEYTTPYQLWSRKIGLIPDVIENDAMRRGKELEPIALQKYHDVNPLYKMSPAIVTHSEYPWAMASLDGFDVINKWGVEIKCMGSKNHAKAVEGYIDPSHFIQMQWQMFCTGCQEWDYYCFDGEEGVLHTVLRDPVMIEEMIVKAKEFLEMINTLTPPPFTELDYEDKSDDAYWNALCESYAHADNQEKMGKGTKERIKEQMIEYSNGRNVKGSWSKFTKVTTKGRVNYDQIPELKGVDLDQYRSEPVTSYRITLDKNNG